MKAQHIELVQQSWALAAPRAEAMAGLFYERLFALRPSLRLLLHGDMTALGRKLIAVISYAVRGLNRVEALRPGLEALGRRHAVHGHYAAFGEALEWALRRVLKDAFTAEVEQAWAAAYDELAGAVRRPRLRQAA